MGNKKKQTLLVVSVIVVAVSIILAAVIAFVISDRNHKKDVSLPKDSSVIIETETKKETIKETVLETVPVQSETDLEEKPQTEPEQTKPDGAETDVIETDPAADIFMTYVQEVKVTSTYNEIGVTHYGDRVMDGNISTGWSEGVPGHGKGESIEFLFDNVYTVKGMSIAAGYQKNEKTYKENSRPSELTVTYSDGTHERIKLKDVQDFQDIKFSKAVETSSIKITIEDIYKGSKYEDTLISEIEFY